MQIRHAPLALAIALALGGCTVGPNYQRPQVTVPAHYKELPGWTQAAPAASEPKGNWWTAFGDPLLDELEPQVAVSNQTVAQSYANYQAAQAAVQVARSALFPTIGVSGSVTRQGGAGSSRGAGTPSVTNAGSVDGTVSWAPDLWGKVRRSVEQNQANAQASAATLANATLSEQLALASTVIELRMTDANIDLLQKTVDAYGEYLRIVTDQGNAGTVPPSDVISARVQLKNAQANLLSLGVARAQYVHAIAVLVGKTPESLDIPHSTVKPSLPEIPVGVPSTLLQRRPDIAIAERQMAAQNAAIGVAEAAYYPNLSLSAADGFTQSPLAGLLNIANHVWSLGADLGATLFEGGARHGQVAAAKAEYEAAVANYRGTVLSAFRNVEDDLSGLRILAQRAEVLDDAVRDATRATEIARNEYTAGTVDFTTVAVAQATQLGDEQAALSVHQQRLLDTISLIGDLGGGWSVDDLALADRGPAKP
jgi:NodT family efflux transporter outer membrane factor (OMF) lipoprotein